jgi:hypothetical protein
VPPVLTTRELNRALLARQGLLEPVAAPPLELAERLVGLQAQVPRDPYVALWARAAAFDPHELSDAVAAGEAVRGAAVRSTLHLVTARDWDRLAPHAAGPLRRTWAANHAKGLRGVPEDEVLAAGRDLLLEAPRTRAELSRALAPRWPGADADQLGHAVVFLLPVVQVPPRGTWSGRGQARWALREHVAPPAPAAEVARRYLAAFGPASAADLRTWSGWTGARAVLDELRPELVVFEDEAGRELLDLPGAPRPPASTPAPVRLLPQFDNALLAHADKARTLAGSSLLAGWGTVLADGFAAGRWRVDDGALRLEGEAGPEVRAEGERLLALLATP